MTSKNVFFGLLAGITITVLGTGFVFMRGNQLLEKKSEELVELKAANEALETQSIELVTAKQEIERYSDLENITQSIVPQDKDQARAVAEIVTLAAQNGIALREINFPSSNLGTSPQASGGQRGRSSGSRSSTPSQITPVDGIKGVYSLEVTIVPQNYVNYGQFIQFLASLEKNRRIAQVTKISIDPQTTDSNTPLVDFLLTINIFTKP